MNHFITVIALTLVFSIMGMAELALFKAAIYPSLSWRYEKAKVTLSQGIKPQWILNLVRVQCLFIMPLIGTFVAMRLYPAVN